MSNITTTVTSVNILKLTPHYGGFFKSPSWKSEANGGGGGRAREMETNKQTAHDFFNFTVRDCTWRNRLHRRPGNERQGPRSPWKRSQEHILLLQSEGTSHMCGHRPLTKKQKPETVESAVGFVLIQILSSHATWSKPFTLASGSG